MNSTIDKPSRKAHRHNQDLNRAVADIDALKRETKELRALVRCLADAIQIAPRFLDPGMNISTRENSEILFRTFVEAVLAKTVPR